ncbi:monooxygenase [Pseudomonas sp. M47T1]|nr:monooxygenase [Pseudomonas sp. M47T1]
MNIAKRMRLNGLRQNTVGHTAMGLWRHPRSQAHLYRTLKHWTDTARLLEHGAFDALFIADALGPLDVYQGQVDAALRDGIQSPCGDPLMLVSAMAAVTRRLGFAVTVSTTYTQPYALARTLNTLDHLTQGRIGWNIVTSALDSAARNLGHDQPLEHDQRYERAEEFMDVVYAAWEGSWADDAVVMDRAAGMFADPARVQPIAHQGHYFSVPDIALGEPSPQRTPVLFQAGSSGAGQRFAARHAEGVFLSSYDPAITRGLVDALRAQAVQQGRDADALKIFNIVTVITAPTDAEAQAKLHDLQQYASVQGSLARYSALLGLDFAAMPADQPLAYSETPGIRGLLEVFTRLDPARTWTPRAIAEFVAIGGGGPVIVGSPATVADELERWMQVADIDGFNVADPVPGLTLVDFVDLVVPELQRRGRVWTDYAGATLREHFGSGPRLGDKHPAARYRQRLPATTGPLP